MIGRAVRFVTARVSRRFFLLFVISAFLPLAAMAILSMSQVRDLLLKQGEARLAANAKSYGMTLFERLLLASEVAVGAASNRNGRVPDEAISQRVFRSLWVLGEKDRVTRVIGEPETIFISSEARARLARGRSVVLVVDEESSPRILLAAAMPPPATDIVIGAVREEMLFGPPDELPAATELCVVEDRSRIVLYCSAPIGAQALRAIGTRSSAELAGTAWESGGETYRTRVWNQFMRAGFGAPDWQVYATQPERFQLAPATRFARIYIPVVFLALLLVTWLTMRQSRSIVGPLGQLAAHARGIAKGEFGAPLALKREDELGELAAALDHMSRQLGSQFASLTALSEIDRLILSTQDTEQVIRTVLARLAGAVPADALAVTLFDLDNPDHARTYFRDTTDEIAMSRDALAPADRAALRDDPRSRWVPAASLPGYLERFRGLGLAGAFVQPIVWRGAVCGALWLGHREEASPSEDERQQARELADRVAVAVSSAWRDEQLYVQAHFDALTGLPNRLLFHDRLEREVVRGQREGRVFALLFIDLDHFKNVNDSFSHSAGDAVLREAARRISRSVRESDTVARQSGDEFTVLLAALGSPQEAWPIAEQVLRELAHEFNVGGQPVFLSASIGIASYPADGRSAEELLRGADTAMYRAKAGGRGQAVFFEERMNAETVARLTLDRDLRVAIERGEMVLHYQPQIDLRTGRVCGVEALVRWNHPKHGLISPVRFVPLAEDSGFIEQLGQWTLATAARQMRVWQDAGLALERVAVNVSPRQFRKATLVDAMRRSVADARIAPQCLEIEITEGLLLDRGEAVEATLREISALGHRIALDDFGTGFSSMSYLTRFPVDTLKIDRVFIDGLGRNAGAEAIVTAIIAMSHALGKTVVAEGVETQAQLARLQVLGCDEVQGFLFCPAVSAGRIPEIVRERNALALARHADARSPAA